MGRESSDRGVVGACGRVVVRSCRRGVVRSCRRAVGLALKEFNLRSEGSKSSRPIRSVIIRARLATNTPTALKHHITDAVSNTNTPSHQPS